MKPTSAQIVWRKYLAEKINEEEYNGFLSPFTKLIGSVPSEVIIPGADIKDKLPLLSIEQGCISFDNL